MNCTHKDVPARIPRRRRITAVAVIAAALGVTVTGHAAPAGVAGLGAAPAEAERVLREHPLRTLDGRTLTLGSLHGDVVVVNFWASWCPPCRRELPRLGNLQTQLAGARVVAVSIDTDVENARRFCRAHGVKVAVVHDGPDGLARALDLRRVPFTLVLDRSGRVAYTTAGSDERAVAAVTTAARQLLAQPATAEAEAGVAR
jgi:thiol-disulfide isomerase/thioredoxin